MCPCEGPGGTCHLSCERQQVGERQEGAEDHVSEVVVWREKRLSDDRVCDKKKNVKKKSNKTVEFPGHYWRAEEDCS